MKKCNHFTPLLHMPNHLCPYHRFVLLGCNLDHTNSHHVLEDNKNPHMFVVPKSTFVHGPQEVRKITHEEKVLTMKIPPEHLKAVEAEKQCLTKVQKRE